MSVSVIKMVTSIVVDQYCKTNNITAKSYITNITDNFSVASDGVLDNSPVVDVKLIPTGMSIYNMAIRITVLPSSDK